jgi:hypothetical protein
MSKTGANLANRWCAVPPALEGYLTSLGGPYSFRSATMGSTRVARSAGR